MSESENKRSSMVQPSAWWDAVDAEAAKANQTRADWIYAMAIEKLPKRVAAKIPERPKNGRPYSDGRK